jgi:hypothetical protein
MEFTRTAIVLRGNADSAITDLAPYLARDASGRWFTHSARGAEIHVWSPAGLFLQTLGRAGRGPGEFATGGKYIGFDSAGLMYVAENNRRWSVFTRDLKFAGHANASKTGVAMSGSGFVSDDGRVISSAAADARAQGASFAVFDRLTSPDSVAHRPVSPDGPRLVRVFGPPVSLFRPVLSQASGGAFWAGRLGDDGDYELRMWSADGTSLRTIRRHASWLPRPNAGRDGSRGSRPTTPELEILHYDGTGVVIVGWVVANPEKWQDLSAITDAARRRAMQDELIDIYIEAIDTEAAELLASIGPIRPQAARAMLPVGFIPQSRTGYRLVDASDGTQSMQVLELRFVPRR